MGPSPIFVEQFFRRLEFYSPRTSPPKFKRIKNFPDYRIYQAIDAKAIMIVTPDTGPKFKQKIEIGHKVYVYTAQRLVVYQIHPV